MGFQADFRAAIVTLLTDYKADVEQKLQIYPARPATIYPPTAFVDSIRETIEYTGPENYSRTPTADVYVLHGLFDSKEAADQRDVFVDGFLEWVVPRFHEAGANTLAGIVEIEDVPNFVPDWLPPERQKTYYATRFAVEGYAGI